MHRLSALALPMLGGCSDIQSALAPAGSDAMRIADLTWVLAAGAAGVLLCVLGALMLALAGSSRARDLLARERAVQIGGIAFPVVALTALLAYGAWVMRATIDPATADGLRIEVTGEQWWWRIAYVDGTGERIAAANEIRVPVGRPVEFVLHSADVIHSFWVPSLAGKVDMIPGRTNRLRLTAERAGIYRGQCAEYCGGAHALMALEVIAMPAAAFDDWLRLAASPAPAPPDEALRRGGALFLAAGCGSCHAVRGTAAAGTVGPDLTRIGERRQIAAATLPTTRANIARFVTDGQHIKPGNAMPPFRMLAADELDAVAAWLESLR